MDWLLDRNKAWMKEIRPFEAIGALEIAATTKTPRGLGGLPKENYVLEVT